MRDPFHKPGTRVRPAVAPRVATGAQGYVPYRTGRNPLPKRSAFSEARKRAVWHPHPDDELSPWKMVW